MEQDGLGSIFHFLAFLFDALGFGDVLDLLFSGLPF
jgi:hypothetical protein